MSTVDDARCGTPAGYHAHYRRNEEPCPPCIEANKDYSAKKYREKNPDAKPRAKKQVRPIPQAELKNLYKVIHGYRPDHKLLPGNPRPKKDQTLTGIYCGAPAGFLKHLKLDSLPCPPCYWAWDRYPYQHEYDLTTKERIPVDNPGLNKPKKLKKPKKAPRGPKTAPTIRPQCGTTTGHRLHQNAGEKACRDCLDAANAYQRDRRRKQSERRAS